MERFYIFRMNTERIQILYTEIDSCFNAGGLGDATYQFAADIIQLLDPDEQDFDVIKRAKELQAMSEKELSKFREEDLKEWESEDPGILEARFNVGENQMFSTLEVLLDCTDFKYIKDELLPMYLGDKPIS